MAINLIPFLFIFCSERPRLEFYVQACAVDVVTKGCAGPPSICRRAVLDILGTDLRTTCTCRTAQQMGDMAAMYDCTEWQRLLWLNPCVGNDPSSFFLSSFDILLLLLPVFARLQSNWELLSVRWSARDEFYSFLLFHPSVFQSFGFDGWKPRPPVLPVFF